MVDRPQVPVAGDAVWFKACSHVQDFEPRLTAQLFSRWRDRVAEVLASDEARAWLLLGDAGAALRELGNPPEAWLEILPLYAELQRGEAARMADHLAHGVPSLLLSALPERYAELLDSEPPLAPEELERLRAFAPRLDELCNELATADVPETIQHDDLHMGNVYARNGRLRVLDWGDSSIAHPFFSLVVTFRFLEEWNGVGPGDPLLARLRACYLEPWGKELTHTFDLAVRVGRFTHAIAWARQRRFLPPVERSGFDQWFAHVLRRALQLI
jgi:hypothetical protein